MKLNISINELMCTHKYTHTQRKENLSLLLTPAIIVIQNKNEM